MAAYLPITLAGLLGKLQGNTTARTAADKQLVRFGIAQNFADPGLSDGLSNLDPALLEFLGDKLANAVYNLP